MVKLFGDRDETVARFCIYHGHLVFNFFFNFHRFGHIQSKNEVALLKGSIFKYSAKLEVKTFWPTKIEK